MSVHELPSSDLELVEIVVASADGHTSYFPPVTGVDLEVNHLEWATIKFYNRLKEDFQGCTPGFWKQNQHFDRWTAPFSPGTLFSDVFDDAFPGLTLLDVLQLGDGHLNALGRHAVAALLDAASPDVFYPLDVEEVIAAFNGAFASGEFEETKDLFEGYNEAFCPLD